MSTPTIEIPPSVKLEIQSPLAESNWLWRRLIAIGGSILLKVILAGTILFNSDWKIVACICALDALVLLVYLIAPSAEQAGKWLASITAWKAGVNFHSDQRVQTPAGAASTSTTTGVPDGNPQRTDPPSAVPADAGDTPPWLRPGGGLGRIRFSSGRTTDSVSAATAPQSLFAGAGRSSSNSVG